MISNTDISFSEKEGDYLIREKVAALYLNEIGEFLRTSFFDSDILRELTNIDLVKEFIENLNHPSILEIIEQDDELILKTKRK